MSQIHIDGTSFSPSLSWPFLFLLFFFSPFFPFYGLFFYPFHPFFPSFFLSILFILFFLFASSLHFFFSREPRISLPPAATPRRDLLLYLSFSLSFFFPLLAAFNYTTATIFTPLVHHAACFRERNIFAVPRRQKPWMVENSATATAAVAVAAAAATTAITTTIAAAVAAKVRVIPNRAA